MNPMGASINQTPTIAEMAGAAILNGAFLAVKYDADGNVTLCDTEGELAAGILLPETPKETAKGEAVTVQMKDIGLAKAGAAIPKGAEVMTDNKGCIVSATTGKFVIGYAMSAATAAGDIIHIDIRKCGYKA